MFSIRFYDVPQKLIQNLQIQMLQHRPMKSFSKINDFKALESNAKLVSLFILPWLCRACNFFTLNLIKWVFNKTKHFQRRLMISSIRCKQCMTSVEFCAFVHGANIYTEICTFYQDSDTSAKLVLNIVEVFNLKCWFYTYFLSHFLMYHTNE